MPNRSTVALVIAACIMVIIDQPITNRTNQLQSEVKKKTETKEKEQKNTDISNPRNDKQDGPNPYQI